MEISIAKQLATQEMQKWGLLPAWQLSFNSRSRRRLGCCIFPKKTIELSTALVLLNGYGEVMDTIRHEIAHALVGPGHGHDRVWQLKAIEVGAKPKRCGHAETGPAPWVLACPGCRREFKRHRRPKRVHGWKCNCGQGGLSFVQTSTVEVEEIEA